MAVSLRTSFFRDMTLLHCVIGLCVGIGTPRLLKMKTVYFFETSGASFAVAQWHISDKEFSVNSFMHSCFKFAKS
jgi:hypothetical protein